jgi:hypothetical protein
MINGYPVRALCVGKMSINIPRKGRKEKRSRKGAKSDYMKGDD